MTSEYLFNCSARLIKQNTRGITYHLLSQSQSVIVVKLTVNSQDYKISLQ